MEKKKPTTKPMSPKLPRGAFVYFGATLGRLQERNNDGSATVKLIAGPGHHIHAARINNGICKLVVFYEASQVDIDRIRRYYQSQSDAIRDELKG